MTNDRAINTLHSLKDYYNDKNEDGYVGFDAVDNAALEMAIKALEQQPKMQDCEYCIHTYGTLGCCDMVNNEWVYDCDFGKEQYKKGHESQPCEDCISREAVIDHINLHPYVVGNRSTLVLQIKTLPSVTPRNNLAESSQDCISRADVLALAEKGTLVSNGNYKSVCKAINDLPSVTPKGVTITDFADKCRECGRIKRCEDCISREAVMKCFKKWQPYMATRLLDYEQELEELPSVTPKTEWIPVSERLPEKNGKYLVTVRNGNVYAGVYDAFSGRFQCAAIAWMPLPQPYNAESEE